MSPKLRLSALVLLLVAITWWLATGANRGWTKSSVPKKTVDPVTGLEGIEYESRFVPGVDLLGIAVLAAGSLAGLSVMFRAKNIHPHANNK